MYNYHNLVAVYSVEFMTPPQHMPISGVPYVKDPVTNMIENTLRQLNATPAAAYAYEAPAAADYTVYDGKASAAPSLEIPDGSDTYDVLGLSA